MTPFLKRTMLSVAALGVGIFSYTHVRMPHSLAAVPTNPSPQDVRQTNQQLQKQLTNFSKQIQDLEAQVKTAQVEDETAQASLSNGQHEAASLQDQLKAKQARAAQLALEQHILARKATQTASQSSAPPVQTVTRASGSGDDGEGDGHGD